MTHAANRYVVGVTVLGGAVVGLSVYGLAASPPPQGWYVLVGLTILTGLATIRMPVTPISLSIADTFNILAALLFGPAAAAVAVALDGLTISLRLVRRTLTVPRLLFNATAPALAMWIAAQVFFALVRRGPMLDRPQEIVQHAPALATFAAVYFVINTLLIAGAISIEQRAAVLDVWRRNFLGLGLTYLGGASIAAVVMVTVDSSQFDLRLLVLVVPLIAVLYLMVTTVIGRMHDEVAHLSSLNRMYHSIIDGAVYGISRVAEDGRLLAVNPALVAMLGYDSAEELSAQNLWRDISAAAHDRARLTPVDGAERLDGVELVWRKKQGGTMIVRVSTRRVVDAGTATLEMMVEDVTVRRALEEQLRQAQKLDAIGRLARGIAHDFNNLLTVIMGSGSMIGERLRPDDPLQVEVRQLMSAGATAASLTRQLLVFSRKQPHRIAEVCLTTLVNDIAELLRRLAGHRVAIDLRLDPELPSVAVDPSQMEQVVMNLVINARDAMPHGGRVTISTSATRHEVVLEIADTGCGMTADVQAHIFEPFFTTKADNKGTGLGLSTVYGVVRQSGGEITVESRVNEGTTFRLVLPQPD